MSKRVYFVTGTDTEVGKTRVSCGLLTAANKIGLSSLGLKPIASGCNQVDRQWRNDDALALQNAASIKWEYDRVNPIALPDAIAPHLAAQKQGKNLSVEQLSRYYQDLRPLPAQFSLIEGAGGWFVPLNRDQTYADFVIAQQLPVILVVSIRLGCINHALLTQAAIKNSGLSLVAWVANSPEPKTEEYADIVATLERCLSAPCLGLVPYTQQYDISQWININPLLT